MSGRIGNLSPQQQAALDELKVRIADVRTEICDDIFLLRYLRSRQFDLDRTEKKFRDTMEFRKKMEVDKLIETYVPPPLLKQYFPTGSLPKPDRNGCPIGVVPMGTIDLKGLIKSNNREDIVKYKVLNMELALLRLRECSASAGRTIETFTVIVDMEGLGPHHLWRPGLQLYTELMQLDEMHYPEIMGKVYIIKPPRIFHTIYSLIKGFIDPNTREKIEVLGANWKEKLLEFTTPDNLPEKYGGTMKETPLICWGGKVPKENYKENDDTLQQQYVKPGKTFIIEVDATEGQELTYDFVTENHDIGFGIFFQAEGKSKEEIIPSERLSAHLGNIEGTIICEKNGKYILEWDNSFSWTRGKNLKYKFELVTPEKEEAK